MKRICLSSSQVTGKTVYEKSDRLNFMIQKSLYRLILLLSFCLFFTLSSSLSFAQGLDSTFGAGGKVLTAITPNNSEAQSQVLVQPDGKIVVIGTSYTPTGGFQPWHPVPFVARYNSNGTLDTTFDTDGIAMPNVNNESQFLGGILQPDGKIIAIGKWGAYLLLPNDILIVRLNTDGSLDTTFNGTGYITRSFGSNNDTGVGVVLQPDGKIVVSAASTPDSSSWYTVLLRYNANGTPDTSFGTEGDGAAVTGGVSVGMIARTSDGKFLALQFIPNSSTNNFIIGRYNSNGTLDSTFGVGGRATVIMGVNAIQTSFAQQSDGKIVIAGYGQTNTLNDALLARLNSDGSIDNSFGTSGKVIADLFNSSNDIINSLLIQPDGKIVIGGSMTSTALSPRSNFVLARFNTNGTLLDKTYTDFDNRGDAVTALTIQDGKVLAVGNSTRYSDGGTAIEADIAIARYLNLTAPVISGAPFDFDGDRKTDFGVYRPDASYWYILKSSTNSSTYYQAQFGIGEDILVPADYNGDGKTDFAVWRPSTGTWYNSINPDLFPSANFESAQWGSIGDIPAPGDFDGDAKADRAIFRPGNGVWYILKSTGGMSFTQFGAIGDRPSVADYDGDGRADISVVRPEQDGHYTWYILQSSTGSFIALQFGLTGDKIAPMDYTGDGKGDIAVWRPSTGVWYVLSNLTSFTAVQFGVNADIPSPGDYDGDGKTDYAIYRPSNSRFYVLQSSTGTLLTAQWGVSTDTPVASSFVR